MCRFLRYWWVQTLNQFWRKCDDVGRQTYSGDRFNLRLHAEDSFRIVWYCTRISAVLIDWLIELRFYVPLDTKRSFRRRSSQPIAWRSTEETKPNTTKSNNTSKQNNITRETQRDKMLNLNKYTKTEPTLTFIFKNCSYVVFLQLILQLIV